MSKRSTDSRNDELDKTLEVTLKVVAVAIAVILLVSVGSIFGAGTSIQNYYLAFRNNVKPERPGP